MTPEEYARRMAVFEGAYARVGKERAAFLDDACAHDPILRRDVEQLLAADESPKDLLKTNIPIRPDIGSKIGTYQVEAKLGEGGMGVVYRALDTKLNRPVAIKFLTSDLADVSARRRFQREAQTASSLNHPHILTVHDVGEWADRQYLVTEYLEGGTLKDWMNAGKRSWRQVVELLTGVADGLATAHAAGILHRDIKPANILIHKSGYAKLADFGLAKMMETAVRGEDEPTVTYGPTQPGLVIGTIAYMSPEQASGKPLDARSDVFSFGIVLYEALSRRRPFGGDSDLEVLQGIIHGEFRPLGEDIPEPLRNVVHRAIAKNPTERYSGMQDLTAALRRLPHESAETVPARISQSKRRNLAMACGVVAVLLAAVLAYRLMVLPAPEKLQSIAVLPLENLSGDPSQEFFSDGMTDELIGELAHISSLHVISRTSVMRYKGGLRKVLPDIAKELKVDAIVEGTVTKTGDKVRITAQLIRARDDRHLWSQKYERDLTNVLTLQGEVARAIAFEIRASLKPEENDRFTRSHQVNPEAYQALLQGNYFLHQNIRGIPKSMEWFHRAIELDSRQSDAHAGLAHALVYAAIYEFRSYAEARTEAQKALKLDASNAGAHNVLAEVKKSLDWDLAAAEEEHRRALQLSPSHLLTRLWLAETLSRLERHDEALAESVRAVSLDPVSALSHNSRSMLLYRARRYDEALKEAQIALDLDPSHVNALLWQGLAYAEKRDFSHAVASLQKGLEMSKAPLFLASLGYAHGLAGMPDEAKSALGQLAAVGAKRYRSATGMAMIYAGMGEGDATFEWLGKAREARDGRVQQLVWPLFDRFRGDPRYLELKNQIGLR